METEGITGQMLYNDQKESQTNIDTYPIPSCQPIMHGNTMLRYEQSLEIGAPLNSFSRQPEPSECITNYAEFSKGRYRSKPSLPQGEWPPIQGNQYSEITMVESNVQILPDQESIGEILEASFHGKVDELAKNEEVIRSLDEVFITQSEDCTSTSLKVLIEGVAGAGKTTLVQKSCKDWADGRLFQQFHLVVLITLRKEGLERAKSIEELLPGDDSNLKQEVVEHIKKTSGKHLLFIFDGFDELSECVRTSNSESIFLKIIQGEVLHKCAVILTSRPYASDNLITDGWIHRHVKILGFTKEQIERYIMQNISDKSAAQTLLKSLIENMAITSVCSTPLSCSILLYIFKQKKFSLPSTSTELFDAFIYSLVKRHAKRQKQKQKVNSLNNLPEPLYSQFKVLCKFAYDNLIQGKFIFTSQDIEAICPVGDVEQNVHSLMTSATSFNIQSEETYYQFLHMTIQEYLAARWIAMQSESVQKHFFQGNWTILKMKQVLVFFAGITELKGGLFGCLERIIYNSELMNLVLKGITVYYSLHVRRKRKSDKIFGSGPASVYHYPLPIGKTRGESDRFFGRDPASVYHYPLPIGKTRTESDRFFDREPAPVYHYPLPVRRTRAETNQMFESELASVSHQVSKSHFKTSKYLGKSRPRTFQTINPFKFKPVACDIIDPFKFETVACSILQPTVSRDFSQDDKCYSAAKNFVCLACMIAETTNSSLFIRKIFQYRQIDGFHLDFCKLPPMDCSVVAKFLSNYPYCLPLLRFNFCSLTGLSLEIFHKIATNTTNCWKQCTEVQMNYNTPSFSTSLSYLPQIPWFQNTKIFVLYGLQYPQGQPPEAFQLHALLSLNALTDLTVTVERIPMNSMEDYEAVLLNFLKSLKSNNTLLNFTYNQSPPTTNCGLFVQLMSALSQNKLSLTLGYAQVVPSAVNAVILHSKTCFKICCNGFISAVKLADARGITVLEAYCQDLSLSNCSCQISNVSKFEQGHAITCDYCNSTDPAVIYCSDCSSNLCESCLTKFHQQIKKFETHKLNSIKNISSDFSILSDSLKTSSISVLDISGCTLTDEVANHIGAGLADSKSLKQLNIKILFITEAMYVFRALQHNNSIKRLKIALAEGICLSEKVSMSLCQMLKSNKSLIVLDLSGFGVTDAVANHIGCGLTENTTLQALNTNSDELKCEGAGYILQSLQRNKSLRTLKVFNLYVQITSMPLTLSVATRASDKQSLSLFISSFVYNTTIEKLQMCTGSGVLDLSGCGISDAVVEKIAAGLTDNSSLKQLDLRDNEITSVGGAHIFKSLEHNTSLNKLLLSCNSKLAIHNSERLGSKLKQMLAANKSLSVLDLSDCGITDVLAQHIASGLVENKTLQALNINSDQLTIEGGGCILLSLQQNEALKILRMFSLHIQITSTPLTLSIATGFDNEQSLSHNIIVSSFAHNTTVDKLQMFTHIKKFLYKWDTQVASVS